MHRGERCSVLLNAYPYTNGHVLVHARTGPSAELDELDADTYAELWRLVRDAVTAIRSGLPLRRRERRRSTSAPRPAPACPTTCTCTACPAGTATPTS